MKTGQKIKKIRKEKKWTQADLAEKLNIHLTHVSRLETSRYAPSLELLKRISNLFGVTVDYLLKEEVEDYQEEIKNKSLAEKIALIDRLEKEEQDAIIKVIDGLITKQKILELLTQKEELVGK